MTTAAKAMISVLKANGIARIFGNPGTTELALLDATVSEGIDFHLCLHEGAAVAMADGYGRATGTVGVAPSSSGAKKRPSCGVTPSTSK